jgi:HEAT repeat protein
VIAALLSTSRHERRHAFDRLAVNRDTAYAARELLAYDEDAAVRARAALFLAKAEPSIANPALRDALEDPMPLVRHAAARALASTGDGVSLPGLTELALRDPIWWVRRAAIVSLAMLGGSIATLRDALDDPFWRVRSAAVRALLSLGEDSDDLLKRLGPPTTARSEGALSYIGRRLGTKTPAAPGALEVPNAIVARLDPDPAIVTARIERGDPATTAFLVECLGDPHKSLRATARKRLARAHDLRALELALLWLDEPRIPHAAQTVIALLDGLDRSDVDPLLDIVFERGGPGALCWAASYVGLTEDDSRITALFAHANDEHPNVRCAIVHALGALGNAAALVSALHDRDALVVRTAALALLDLDATHPALASLGTTDVVVRRALVHAAEARGDRNALRTSSSDPDPRTRAMALAALGPSPACLDDPDPWVRMAGIDEASAERLLASDPHPWVRRAAFRAVAGERDLGMLASRCDDPWIQTRAAAMLDPRNPEQLIALLRLARDKSPAVRAAAADALERANIDAELDAVLKSVRGEEHDAIRIAALAHRSRHFEDEDFERLKAAWDDETPAVRAWIDDVRGIAPEPAARSVSSHTMALLRELGQTGMRTSSLVVSGAGMLPSRSYAGAMHAGCNLFFWEPRYHTLGRMLAHEPDAGIVCGSYEATERAIVADVERYLRRLHRDALDVFLLFWARSPARVDAPLFDVLARLKAQGKVRAIGFSTHDREIAGAAIQARAWDVLMIRHSAVHPGAEQRVLPLAHAKGTAVLGFSALSYGRVLSPTISAPDAYRYSLSQPGVSACLSAPRTPNELEQNLAVLQAPQLSAERQAELRAHGQRVHEESRDFARSIRRHPLRLADAHEPDLAQWLLAEEALDPRFE